mmetsp:Transcript_52633/g.115407  ORF Transcript_52633/g.115407 Transcript_52633/m.115407 type:complete len:187 (+) Transcript_52633:108-668(+)
MADYDAVFKTMSGGDKAYVRELQAKLRAFENENQRLRGRLETLQQDGHGVAGSPYLKYNPPESVRDPRVVKVSRYLDPKYSAKLRMDDVSRVAAAGAQLEEELGLEVEHRASEAHYEYLEPSTAFRQAEPHYRVEEGIWQRFVQRREMQEAMGGNVGSAMPEPVIFSEEYPNFKEGKYVRDDCRLA